MPSLDDLGQGKVEASQTLQAPLIEDGVDITSAILLNIERAGQNEYFDFHVPLHNNYWMAGAYHHNCGKSSIIRALHWVALNKPTGDWMTTFGEDVTAATLTLDDCKVTRKRGKSNLYFLDGKKYKSFGPGGVPSDIASKLRLSEVNFQRQGDPPFWFGESAVEVSRRLNAVVDLSVIDYSLDNAQSQVREARAERKVSEKRLGAAQTQLLALQWVPRMLEGLQEIEELDRQAEIMRGEEETASLLIAVIDRMSTKLTEEEKSNKLLAEILAIAEEGVALQEWTDSITHAISSIERAEQVAAARTPDLSELEALAEEYRTLKAEADAMSLLVDKIQEEERWLITAKDAATSAEVELKRKTGGLCPICGRPNFA